MSGYKIGRHEQGEDRGNWYVADSKGNIILDITEVYEKGKADGMVDEAMGCFNHANAEVATAIAKIRSALDELPAYIDYDGTEHPDAWSTHNVMYVIDRAVPALASDACPEGGKHEMKGVELGAGNVYLCNKCGHEERDSDD